MRVPEPCLCGAEDCISCHPERFRRVCGKWIDKDTPIEEVEKMIADDEARAAEIVNSRR